MSEYEDILEEFNNDKERTAVDRAIALAKNNEEKANITIAQKGIEDYIQLIITIIIVIAGVNWLFDIPLLWHSYGHFGFLTHFGKCVKELYFSWGYNHDKFLFSLEGIRSYIYVIPAIYEFAYAFSDGLASVQKNGKYGYINIKGEVVIPLQYEEASPFVNGTATVMYKDTINGKINRHFFMINKKGEKISEDFDNISWRTRKSEMIMMARRGNKWGAINGIGQIKIPFIYDEVKGRLPQHASVSDHFVSVSQDGKWGFINLASSENSVIVFPQYENVGVFSFGAAWVYDGQSYSFVDKTGSIICGGYVYCTPFNAMGLSCVKITMDTDEAYLINKKGEIVYYCSRDERGRLYNLRRKE